ncbi:MAG: SusC/RagA family TonB-linked outer membrane protein, partial [Flavobacteriaceae bacterium]|nr:SusC/RagA family TonB-linked outer membrane protein [Flavobacteriaceae bacterium]
MNVLLKDDTEALDEVVVIGYGSQKKNSVIAAVSKVKTKDIENLPVANVTQGLAGRSPGLIIQSGTGLNAKSTIRMRGGGTPLVVIDGIIRDYNDFENIAPEEIESFQVLKDASATAAYGARAANGIIQITTKKGKKGSISVDYSFLRSYSQPSFWAKKLNSYDRAVQKNIALENDGKTADKYTEDDLQKYADGSDPFGHPNTDWRSLVLRDFAPQTKHNIRLSGGSETNNYFVSLGHLYKESLYKINSHNMSRTNFRVNQQSIIKSIGLTTTASLDGALGKDIHPSTGTASNYYGVFSHIQNKSPMDRGVNKYGDPYNMPDNPVAETSLKGGYLKNFNNYVNGRLSLEWQLPWVKELKLRATGNYNYYVSRSKNWRKNPPLYDWDSKKPIVADKPRLSLAVSEGYQYTLQYFADYQKTLFEGADFSLLVGYEASYGFSTMQTASREEYEFPIDQIGVGPDKNQKNGGWESENGRAGYIIQVKQSYMDRYFLEGSVRYDGSDNFPKNKRWGAFASVSGGWLVSKESFMDYFRENNIFNTLKLRGSYGEVGNDNIGRFRYLESYGFNPTGYVIDGKLQPVFTEGNAPSPDITWYTSKQTDLGFEFSSLSGRLFGSFGYFYYETTGYLAKPSDEKLGYVDPLGNSGRIPLIKTDGEHRREGFEAQLGWRHSVNDDFSYGVSFNITKFDQLWAKKHDESLESKKNPYRRQSQQTGFGGYGHKTLGFYKDAQDVLNSPKLNNSKNLTAGDLKYDDFNGDGQIDGTDKIRLGTSDIPRANYGINLNLRYKGLSVNALLQGTSSFHRGMGNTIKMADGNAGSLPVYEFQTDYWTPNNLDARFPRLLSGTSVNGGNNGEVSDF